ncbi:MAG: glucokinase [Gammaproteobacteria bacterium]|nr:glucokinase [Gammaproteobacteria bacterium]
MNIIAADVGGTKTRLIKADASKSGDVLYEARYECSDFESFEALLKTFFHDSGSVTGSIETMVLAFPGLVNDTSARLTNLPWIIEKQSLTDNFGVKNIVFMNDFQASALGTMQLQNEDQVVLNPGILNRDVSGAVTRVAVGAGTGLGVAWAQEDGPQGHRVTHAYHTEGGHIDFAPVDETQIELLRFLQQRFAHVSYERILSGDGLVSLYTFFAAKAGMKQTVQKATAEWINNHSQDDEAADKALSLFVRIYGAYIGNIALLFKPRGGIFITGGIAAKMLEKMQSENFIDAYLNKGRMRVLVEQIAVYLVTDERVGVLGAMSEAIKMQQTSLQQVSK